MAVLFDSNAILDAATDDPTWGAWSARALARAADRSVLVINPIVFAEVSVGFDGVEDLEEALPSEIHRRDPLPHQGAFLPSRAPPIAPRGRELRVRGAVRHRALDGRGSVGAV